MLCCNKIDYLILIPKGHLVGTAHTGNIFWSRTQHCEKVVKKMATSENQVSNQSFLVCRSCLASRDPYCGWTRGSTCSFLRPGTRWGQPTHSRNTLSPMWTVSLLPADSGHVMYVEFNWVMCNILLSGKNGHNDHNNQRNRNNIHSAHNKNCWSVI